MRITAAMHGLMLQAALHYAYTYLLVIQKDQVQAIPATGLLVAG
jgi:hypothetical protein